MIYEDMGGYNANWHTVMLPSLIGSDLRVENEWCKKYESLGRFYRRYIKDADQYNQYYWYFEYGADATAFALKFK